MNKNITYSKQNWNITSELSGFSFRPVPDEEIQALIHKKTPLAEKIIFTIIGGLLILGLIIMICSVRINQKRNQISLLKSGSDIIFLYNGEKIDGSVKNAEQWKSSADMSSAYVIDNSGAIYAADKNGVVEIGKHAENAVISPNGNFILFSDDEGDSSIYNVKKNKICTLPGTPDIHTAVFSPDGKTLAYNETDSDDLYIYSDGKSKLLDSEVRCLAVSNGAKNLYAYRYTTEPENPDELDYEVHTKLIEPYLENITKSNYGIELYYYPSENSKKRKTLYENGISAAWFNSDISEIVFWNTESETYFCKKDKAPVKLAESCLYPVTNSYYFNTGGVYIGQLDSLLEMNYYNFNELYYVDKKVKSKIIEDNISLGTMAVELSENEKNICYINDTGDLYLTDTTKGCGEIIWSDVSKFISEDNVKEFYVLKSNGDLYHINKYGGTFDYGGLYINKNIKNITQAPSGGIYYINNDGELYYSKGSSSAKIEIDSDSIVCVVISDDNSAMCMAYDQDSEEYSTYISKRGNDQFDKCCEGCMIADLAPPYCYDYTEDYL